MLAWRSHHRGQGDPGGEGHLASLSKNERGGPRERKVVIDSGASVAALPKGCAMDYPLKKVPVNNFRTASGQSVKSMGEREPVVRLENGAMAKMNFTVMDVHRPLAAVSKMVAAGHRIVFDSET